MSRLRGGHRRPCSQQYDINRRPLQRRAPGPMGAGLSTALAAPCAPCRPLSRCGVTKLTPSDNPNDAERQGHQRNGKERNDQVSVAATGPTAEQPDRDELLCRGARRSAGWRSC
jgi:hypothetical protein